MADQADQEVSILDVIYGGQPMPESPTLEWITAYNLELTDQEERKISEECYIQDCADMNLRYAVLITNTITGEIHHSGPYENINMVAHLADNAIASGDRAEVISNESVWDTCSYCGYHNGWYSLPDLIAQNSRDGGCCAGCGAQ